MKRQGCRHMAFASGHVKRVRDQGRGGGRGNLRWVMSCNWNMLAGIFNIYLYSIYIYVFKYVYHISKLLKQVATRVNRSRVKSHSGIARSTASSWVSCEPCEPWFQREFQHFGSSLTSRHLSSFHVLSMDPFHSPFHSLPKTPKPKRDPKGILRSWFFFWVFLLFGLSWFKCIVPFLWNPICGAVK